MTTDAPGAYQQQPVAQAFTKDGRNGGKFLRNRRVANENGYQKIRHRKERYTLAS